MRNNEEYQEQCAVVQYLELKKIKFTAIPNSTYTKSWGVKIKNKMSGVRPGLPDLFMIINCVGIFIEMKRKKGGVISPEQKQWIDKINDCPGLSAHVCKGFDEAKKVIDAYAN